MKLTERDARHAGVCRRMRAWFRKHNLDWDAFCGEGVESSELLEVGDQSARIKRVMKVKNEQR